MVDCKLVVAGSMVGLALAVVAQAVSTGEYEVCDQVVRRGGVEGRPYWNSHAIMFMYPPAFDFKSIDGAVRYRFDVIDDIHDLHVFRASLPSADLSPIWTKLRVGYVTVRVIGEDASGRDIGLSGTKTFWKKAAFREGAYPKAKFGYADCARLIYGYLFHDSDSQYLLKTGKIAENGSNRFPAKMLSQLVNAMIDYAKLAPSTHAEAHKLACNAADALLAISEGQGSRYPFFPPTYNPTNYPLNREWWPKRRECMTIYPASAASAYLRLYETVGDDKYIEAAKGIAETYLGFQGNDGSWPLIVNFDEGPIGRNRVIPIEIAEMLEELFGIVGDCRYREAADRAFRYIEKNLIESWNWEGQFEDTPVTMDYRNLTKHPACSTAIYLLKRYPGDKEKLALARELLRFAEDIFVNWEKPYDNGRRVPDKTKFTGYYNHFWKQDRWIMPSVFEQFGCYTPVDASASKLIFTYIALYRAEKNPLDLAKARALGDTVTRCTSNDGLEATWWTEGELRSGIWPNCMSLAASALQELANVEERRATK